MPLKRPKPELVYTPVNGKDVEKIISTLTAYETKATIFWRTVAKQIEEMNGKIRNARRPAA